MDIGELQILLLYEHSKQPFFFFFWRKSANRRKYSNATRHSLLVSLSPQPPMPRARTASCFLCGKSINLSWCCCISGQALCRGFVILLRLVAFAVSLVFAAMAWYAVEYVTNNELFKSIPLTFMAVGGVISMAYLAKHLDSGGGGGTSTSSYEEEDSRSGGCGRRHRPEAPLSSLFDGDTQDMEPGELII
jgi:hypothetical protein